MGPNFGCSPAGDPDATIPTATPTAITPNLPQQRRASRNTYANYLGLRVSELRSSSIHTWKIGMDVDRENSERLANLRVLLRDCNCRGNTDAGHPATPPTAIRSATTRRLRRKRNPGRRSAFYAQDKWQAAQNVVFNYGVRYDHSTGYTSGYMIEPRLGVNVSDGGKNIFTMFYGRYYAAPLLEDVRQACVIFAAQGGCATTTPALRSAARDGQLLTRTGLQHTFNGNLTGWVNIFEKNVVNVLDTTQLLNTPLFAVYNNAIGHNQGVEIRLQDRQSNGSDWFFTSTISGSYAGGISGSTFLFPPDVNQRATDLFTGATQSRRPLANRLLDRRLHGAFRLGPHVVRDAASQTTAAASRCNSKMPTSSLSGTLPAHTTFDLSAGRIVLPGKGPGSQGLGVTLDVLNVLNTST